MNDKWKSVLTWLVVGLILFAVFKNFEDKGVAVGRLTYDQFYERMKAGDIKAVAIEKETGMMRIKTSSDAEFYTIIPDSPDRVLIGDLLKNKISIIAHDPEKPGILMETFIRSVLPILLFAAIWIFFMRQLQGGGKGGALSFGKSKARMLSENKIKVTFADVAGVDEAKEDVKELVDFLKEPEKFKKLGGVIPRGILMVGPPGTGKTLLAKAIAGEAKAPFFSISGSDFVEMFVGVGASRVRDMCEQAKKYAPCIVFIDEIDAVGRHRGSGMGGGHDEREQTLNQLLVEMDGFEGNEGVIIIAATNRPDVLDKALLRPGRFDRQVYVGLPDIKGREQILRVHLKKIRYAKDVNPLVIARGTPGFSGADLANLVNEAALFAARENKTLVAMEQFDKAKDKIMMGAERRSMVMKESEKLNTAYHEAGHAIVGLLSKEHDPVYKVSIIPRGMALGVTMYLPEEDQYSHSRLGLHSRIASLLAGRIAEELTLGKDGVTTGASNDIERATSIARNMVITWGLSDVLGPLNYDTEDKGFVPGKQRAEVSDKTLQLIDTEVRKIIDDNYKAAMHILTANMNKLHVMAQALIKYETIDADQIEDIMHDRSVREPKNWRDNIDILSTTPSEDAMKMAELDKDEESKDKDE